MSILVLSIRGRSIDVIFSKELILASLTVDYESDIALMKVREAFNYSGIVPITITIIKIMIIGTYNCRGGGVFGSSN